jgi:hypothetical protein
VRQVQNQMVHAREYYRAILKLRPGQADVAVRATSCPPVLGPGRSLSRSAMFTMSFIPIFFFILVIFSEKKSSLDT